MTTSVVRYERAPMYPKQEEALFTEARYGIVEASTKSGKTVGCLVWLHEQAALHGRANRNFWWVAPTYSVTKIAYRRLKTFLPEGSFVANETELTLRLKNDAIIWFKSAEKPDNLYGEDVYAAVIDEATRVKEEAWHAVRSTLTATGGPVRIIGNVKGRRNWAYKLARRAEAGVSGYHYARLTVWDAVEAGIFDEAEAEDARAVLPPDVYRELYLAEASDDSEAFFQIENVGIVEGFPDTARVCRAWDYAASQPRPGSDPDYTVGAKVAHDGTRTFVLDIERGRWSPDRVLDLTAATAARDGQRCDILVEEEFGAAGKILIAQLQQRLSGFNVRPASVSGGKMARAYHFAAALNAGRVMLLEADWNSELLLELEDFPEGGHDDQVDALAHAYNHLAPDVTPRLRWI